MSPQLGPAGRIARFFIDSKLTPLIIVASLLLGVFSVIRLPREEEPQIIVPMIDVLVQAPGMGSKEVESRVTSPMEKLLWEIPGVEYVYSTSSAGMSMAIARFYVGTDEEKAIVRTYNKMFANFDRIPQGVSQPLIKPRSIDDVPILGLTFHGKGYDHYQLRRIAAEVERQVKEIPDVSETTLIGGQRPPQRLQPLSPCRRPAAAAGEPATPRRELQPGEQGTPRRDGQVPPERCRSRSGCGRRLRRATRLRSRRCHS